MGIPTLTDMGIPTDNFVAHRERGQEMPVTPRKAKPTLLLRPHHHGHHLHLPPRDPTDSTFSICQTVIRLKSWNDLIESMLVQIPLMFDCVVWRITLASLLHYILLLELVVMNENLLELAKEVLGLHFEQLLMSLLLCSLCLFFSFPMQGTIDFLFCI